MQGTGIVSVELRTGMRLLCLKSSLPKKVLDEMKVVYGEDAPSYDVVKHWHGQFKCDVYPWKQDQFLGTPCPPLMMPPSSRFRPPF